MKKMSIWEDIQSVKKSVALDHDLNVDVLIIGGGITGVSLAYQLKDSGMNICLVDSHKIGSGVTAKTTGKLTYLQGIIYSKLKRNFSFLDAKLYYQSQKDAILEVKRIIEKERIQCDFEEVESVVSAYERKEILELKEEKQILEKMGVSVKEVEGNDTYSISVLDTAVFHPLKYVYALRKICCQCGVQVYENTPILQIQKKDSMYQCFSNHGVIQAKKVVVACHYPFFLFPFFMPLHSYIEQSYLMAFPVSKNEKRSFISNSKEVVSYRYHEDQKIYKLILSNSHHIGHHLNRQSQFEELLRLLQFKPEYVWSNNDLITVDSLPYIGRIRKNEPNLYLATGYNTWGMTNGTLSGMILKDLILDKKNRYAMFFSPSRGMKCRFYGQAFLNAMNNGKSMIQNKLVADKKWYSNQLSFQIVDGKSVAIYEDEKGRHMVYNKCPHMGCSLIFNEVEKTWECPCHASKFNLDGICIQGPSRYSISVSKKR